MVGYEMVGESIQEQARRLGISISTLRRHIKEKKKAEEVRDARWALAPKSAGWDPFAGPKKKHK